MFNIFTKVTMELPNAFLKKKAGYFRAILCPVNLEGG